MAAVHTMYKRKGWKINPIDFAITGRPPSVDEFSEDTDYLS